MIPRDRADIRREGWSICWIAALGLAYSLWCAPLPGVNEPHYLTKARHFWNPEWCDRDLFLQSANAHVVFYVVWGWLPEWISFTATAWIGRIAGCVALACGWQALSRRLWPTLPPLWPWACTLTAFRFWNWSGEWVVGGVESKVFAYACVWLALAASWSGQSLRAAAWSGLATSWHPVIGLWHTLCLLAASLLRRESPLFAGPKAWRSSVRPFALSCCGWFFAAAPGLIPALAMLRQANPAESYQADYIQVFYRLAHHLNPERFPLWSSVCAGGLLVWLTFQIWRRRENSIVQQWERYVWWAGWVALCGVLIRLIPWILPEIKDAAVAKWLKFYPFRLFDALVPLWIGGQVAHGAAWVSRRLTWVPSWRGIVLPLAVLLISIPWLLAGELGHPRGKITDAAWRDWLTACAWARQHTAPDALFLTTSEGWGFRWYAERAEYVNHKDCPQDAHSLVEWNRRQLWIGKWSRKYQRGGFSRSECRVLRNETHADFIICHKFGPCALPIVFKTATFRIYDLRGL